MAPLTQNERILLHLARHQRFREEWEVPAEVSQEGIGARLEILVNNVSRSLKGLLSGGIVEERLAHVRGGTRRLKTYFLSERGLRAVAEIESRLREAPVVVELDGSPKEMRLGAVEERLQRTHGRRPDLLRLVEAIRAGRTAESDLFAATGAAEGPDTPRFIERLAGAPGVEGFVGRTDELAAVAVDLDDRKVAAVVIWGLAGVGKSSLAAKVLAARRGRAHLLWHRCAEWDTLRGLVSLVAEFLQAAGRSRLAAARRQRWTSPSELLAPLASDLRELPAILAFDDIHRLPAESVPFLAACLEAARGSGVHLLVLSRNLPSFYGRGEAVGGAVVERVLGGLSEADARTVLPPLSEPEFFRAYLATRGHPLFLRLLASGGGTTADLPRYIEEEIYAGLSGPERAVLRTLAISRVPLPFEALPGGEAVVSLQRRGLVVEGAGRFDLHDIVRDFLLTRLTREERTGLHRRAAEHWRASEPAEALHHLLAAEAWSEAGTLALDVLPGLADEDPVEALRLLSELTEPRVPPGIWPDLLFFRGTARERLGDAAGALEDYRSALAFEERRGADKGILALLHQRIAGIPLEAAEETLASHEKALRLFKEADDPEGEATAWLAWGAFHRRRGDLVQAREGVARAKKALGAAKSPKVEAAVEYHRALVDLEGGDLAAAASHFREAEQGAVLAGDAAGALAARGGVAEVEFLRGDRPSAIQIVSELAAQGMDPRVGTLAREVVLRFARMLHAAGDEETALRFARDAARKAPPRLLGRAKPESTDLAAESLAATLSRALGRKKEAAAHRGEALRIAWALGRPAAVGRELIEKAIDAESRGDLDGAVQALQESTQVLRAAGEVRGLAAVHLTWGRILEKKDDSRGAEERYEEAARWAEAAGDRLGQARALEGLGEVTGPRGREALAKARALYAQLGRRVEESRIEGLLK